MLKELDNGLRTYLNEITKTELLTAEEEVILAGQIAEGNEKAREHMIRANLRLVVKIARDYENYGVPLMDLISEGNIGLMKAVQRFDPAKGGKFSTYGAWWIKQSVKRALANQGKTVRLPVHMVDKLSKLRSITAYMTDELGRVPSDDEIAEEVGLPRQKIAMLRQAAQSVSSMDAPITDGETGTVGDFMSDDDASDPLDSLETKNLHTELEDLRTHLDEREARIIDARFGLDGSTPKTLEEVGQEFGVTRERIRQVQNIALEKMRKILRKKERGQTIAA